MMKYRKFLESTYPSYKLEQDCKTYDIKNYTINSDGSIDVDGDVFIAGWRLPECPLKFNIVNGDFDCSDNRFTTMKNFPKKITGWLNASDNDLVCTKDIPQEIGGSINLSFNKLEKLTNIPKVVNEFVVVTNKLTTLVGGPEEVNGHFKVGDNQLRTLEGSPKKVQGDFNVYGNKLYTLVGGPNEVGGIYIISDNNNICDLVGFPELHSNGMEILSSNTPIDEVLNLFGPRYVSSIDLENDILNAIHALNEWEAIDGLHKTISYLRLKEVYLQLNKKIPTKEELSDELDHYKITE